MFESYDASFYLDRADRYRKWYRRWAEWLDHNLHPKQVIDVGCGAGWFIDYYGDRGIGIEGSSAAISLWDGLAIRHNLSKPLPFSLKADLVVCIETAEHLSEDSADQLVATLNDMGGTLLFTAAPPGQGGFNHVNEQPQEYWLEKFDRVVDHTLLYQFKTDFLEGGCKWVIQNALILKEPGHE